MKAPSKGEVKFACLWPHAALVLTREHRFHPARKWRFDFAHTPSKTAIEIEGGSWVAGRHTRGSGFRKDCEKYNAATALGWAVFRLTSDMISQEQIEQIARTIKERNQE